MDRLHTLTGPPRDAQCRLMANPMATLRRRTLRLGATVLLALSALLLGFAHKPVSLRPTAFDLAAYTLPDGTPPFLCHTDADEPDGAAHHDRAGALCDACLLTSSPGLGAVASAVLPAPAPLTLARLAVVDQVAIGRATPAPTSRGPPRA